MIVRKYYEKVHAKTLDNLDKIDVQQVKRLSQ